jgi:S-(hydroxymethyl)glutathione dehydrogenase / alcohol dehydrogenase
MRAVILSRNQRALQILDLEQEPPKAGEVRVRVKAAGVCMSD